MNVNLACNDWTDLTSGQLNKLEYQLNSCLESVQYQQKLRQMYSSMSKEDVIRDEIDKYCPKVSPHHNYVSYELPDTSMVPETLAAIKLKRAAKEFAEKFGYTVKLSVYAPKG